MLEQKNKRFKIKFSDLLETFPSVETIAIVGHVRPDGDCLGSIFGLYHYLQENYPFYKVVPYVCEVPNYLAFLAEGVPYRTEDDMDEYDLTIALDASSLDRIEVGKSAFFKARHTLLIDHHITCTRYAEENIVRPKASSTSEILVSLLDGKRISRKASICFFTGIIQDSGVFRYSSTRPSTLKMSAELMNKKIPFDEIIRKTEFSHPFNEMQMLAEVILSTKLLPEEKFAYAFAPLYLQEKYGLTPSNLGAIVSRMAEIEEADVVLFCYEVTPGEWKGSLRSRSLNITPIATYFNGGGHSLAAGFSFNGDPEKTVHFVRDILASLREKDF